MSKGVRIGRGREIFAIPRMEWEQGLVERKQHVESRCKFMSPDHHRVRNFVVREIPRVGKPLSPKSIARNLNWPVARVNSILDDLEKHLTFLFRNEEGSVTRAYPLTVDRTPHHISFSTGEQVYAA